MTDRQEVDIKILRKDLLGVNLSGGDLEPGTAVGETEIDPVTGLLTRIFWEAEMAQQYRTMKRRGDELFAIVMIDLKKFKKINDKWGHPIGDLVLGAWGSAIKDRFKRKADIEGRYGGDEMIAMMIDYKLTEGKQPEDEENTIHNELVNKVREILSQGKETNEIPTEDIEASVGMAVWDGKESLEGVIKRADERLYRQKELK